MPDAIAHLDSTTRRDPEAANEVGRRLIDGAVINGETVYAAGRHWQKFVDALTGQGGARIDAIRIVITGTGYRDRTVEWLDESGDPQTRVLHTESWLAEHWRQLGDMIGTRVIQRLQIDLGKDMYPVMTVQFGGLKPDVAALVFGAFAVESPEEHGP